MNKGLRVSFLGLVLACAFLVCLATGAGAANPATATVTVDDQPARFKPSRVVIKVDQSVEWKNTGKILHSATDDPAKVEHPQAVSLPPGAAPFDSGFLTPGMSYQHEFTVPGVYRYVCLPHQADGMVGEVVVKRK